MFFRYAWLLILAIFPYSLVLPQDIQPVVSAIDSTRAGDVPMSVYSEPAKADTHYFSSGDSIFVHDGELFYRAHAKDRDFFVSKAEILKHSDSLVIYQTLRLTPAAQAAGAPDTIANAKAERRRCTAITKNGTRCRRMALPGSDKCWQHKK